MRTHSAHLKLDEQPVGHGPLVLGPDERPDSPLDGLGDVVYVLRLDQRLEVLLEDACKVVLSQGRTGCLVWSKHSVATGPPPHLQLRAPEVLQNLLPRWRRIKLAEIRLELACHDLQGRALPDAVCADEAEYLSRPRRR